MIKDALVNAYLLEVHQQIALDTEALTAGSFEKAHQFARVQGRIDGLKIALQLLSKVAEEQDK